MHDATVLVGKSPLRFGIDENPVSPFLDSAVPNAFKLRRNGRRLRAERIVEGVGCVGVFRQFDILARAFNRSR